MRILGLDLGDKRIGIAMSDPLCVIAQGLNNIDRVGDIETIKKICELAKTHEVYKIVLGLPKNMDGSMGFQGEKVMRFTEELKKVFPGEIVHWDERLTTKSAVTYMIEDNLSRKDRKKKVDRIAAVLILQGYLDFLNRFKKEGG